MEVNGSELSSYNWCVAASATSPMTTPGTAEVLPGTYVVKNSTHCPGGEQFPGAKTFTKPSVQESVDACVAYCDVIPECMGIGYPTFVSNGGVKCWTQGGLSSCRDETVGWNQAWKRTYGSFLKGTLYIICMPYIP